MLVNKFYCPVSKRQSGSGTVKIIGSCRRIVRKWSSSRPIIVTGVKIWETWWFHHVVDIKNPSCISAGPRNVTQSRVRIRFQNSHISSCSAHTHTSAISSPIRTQISSSGRGARYTTTSGVPRGEASASFITLKNIWWEPGKFSSRPKLYSTVGLHRCVQRFLCIP